MTPTEAVKILLEGIEEAVRHLNPQVREPVRALAALQRAALAATAEPKGDGILRTLEGKPMYLVGRTTDEPATAEPTPCTAATCAGQNCPSCRAGYAAATAEPATLARKSAPTYSVDHLAEAWDLGYESGTSDLGDMNDKQRDLDAIIAKAVGRG